MDELLLALNGRAVTLYPEIQTMILALMEYQASIHQQGVGAVTLDYHTSGGTHRVTLSLSRLNFKVIARPLS